jgi:hypothetical protein
VPKRMSAASEKKPLCPVCCLRLVFLTSPKPTVCPANDSARMLSYQELPTSIQLERGHGQEAKRGEAGEPRTTRNVQRLGRFSSRVQPPGCPCSWCGA